MNPKTALTLAIFGVAGALVFIAVKKGQAIVDAVNPFNNDNIIARGFDEVITLGQADDGFSLGSFIFDLFNPEFDPNAPDTPQRSGESIEFIKFEDLPKKRGTVT